MSKKHIDDRMIRTSPDGKKWVLQDKWLRITQNPVTDLYPKTGDTIEVLEHSIISDGSHIVESVTEFEPGICRDDDGRDIRVSILGVGRDFHGPSVLVAMEKARGERVQALSEEKMKDGWRRPFRKFFLGEGQNVQ